MESAQRHQHRPATIRYRAERHIPEWVPAAVIFKIDAFVEKSERDKVLAFIASDGPVRAWWAIGMHKKDLTPDEMKKAMDEFFAHQPA